MHATFHILNEVMKLYFVKRLDASFLFPFFTICQYSSKGENMTLTLNQKDTGYRGIWYYNQPSGDEYVYKYSGGLGTYCAKHRPFAVYRPEVEKTFFCYGGTPVDAHLKHAKEDLNGDRAFSRQSQRFSPAHDLLL